VGSATSKVRSKRGPCTGPAPHYGVRLAFQNCHRAAVFHPEATTRAHADFITAHSQILNQRPELVDC